MPATYETHGFDTQQPEHEWHLGDDYIDPCIAEDGAEEPRNEKWRRLWGWFWCNYTCHGDRMWGKIESKGWVVLDDRGPGHTVLAEHPDGTMAIFCDHTDRAWDVSTRWQVVELEEPLKSWVLKESSM